MMATVSTASPTPATATPSGMSQGAALGKLASATRAPVTASTQPSFIAPAAQAAPAYVPETGTPQTSVTSIPTGLPSQQSSMLHDLASLSLGFAHPVGPGEVTVQQQQVLNAWKQNAHSDYSQFMLNQGLAATVQNPDALFNEEALVAQAQWSRMDTQGAMLALRLSASDYDAWMKLEEQKHKSMMGKIFGVAEFAAGLAVDVFAGWTGVGAVAGTSLMASGAKSFANS